MLIKYSNIFSVNNILFYITMITLEYTIKDFYKNNKNLIESITNDNDLIYRISYS